MDRKHIKAEHMGRIFRVTIEVPEIMDVTSVSLREEFNGVIDEICADTDVGVVVIAGMGKTFMPCDEHQEAPSVETREDRKAWTKLFTRIEEMDKVVIAMVNGRASGVGCELALACDLRYASTKASFGQTGSMYGMLRLVKTVGPAKAREMVYTVNMMTADEALCAGLVNGMFVESDLMRESLAIAHRIAAKPAGELAYAKKAINFMMNGNLVGIMLAENGLCGKAPAGHVEPAAKETGKKATVAAKVVWETV